MQLTGAGGLLQQLTKRVLESALEGEITDHLGYDKHDPAGKNGGNSRNGVRAKTVLTDVGPVEIALPRDRAGVGRRRHAISEPARRRQGALRAHADRHPGRYGCRPSVWARFNKSGAWPEAP
jgi:transposase-like protein